MNSVAEPSLITSPPGESKAEQKEAEKDLKKENLPPNPLQNNLAEYQNCQHHRDIGKIWVKKLLGKVLYD